MGFINAVHREMRLPELRKEMFKVFQKKLGRDLGNLSQEEFNDYVGIKYKLSEQTFKALLDSKLFVLNESTAKLLNLTKNELYIRQLPFDPLFIDTSFQLEQGGTLKGILIFKEPKEGFILGCARIEHEDGLPPFNLYFDVFSRDLETLETGNRIQDSQQLVGVLKNKQIQLFICSFLDFLNNPEVKTREVYRTEEQNEKRKRRGKFPIPPCIFINITGKLYEYENKLESSGHLSYSHRFWVRGHFRVLKNEERYGDKVGIKIWILPYIKGEGVLIDKVRKVRFMKEQLKEGDEDGDN